MKLVDLTGRTFGRLKVIARGPNTSRGTATWICECTCKDEARNVLTVTSQHLQLGHTKSCGCLRSANAFGGYRGPVGTRWTQRAEQRFWSYVDKSPGHGPNGDCWLWTGGVKVNGYGIFSVNGKRIRAHRFAWELKHGPVPEGMKVLHDCDNRPCVRDEHLIVGTQSRNIKDAVKRGRVIPPTRGKKRRKPNQGEQTNE